MKVTVIGAGAWGTALANLLCQNGHAVTLWAHEPALLEQIKETGRNELFLPGVAVSRDLRVEPVLEQAVEGSAWAVIAVPSGFFRGVTRRISSFQGVAVSVTKGIEYASGLTMSGILAQTMPKATPEPGDGGGAGYPGGGGRGAPGPGNRASGAGSLSSAVLSRL